ncbi:MAG TPA: SURF1 family protein [Novosphingobium sp.]|nr:SURF1 family protein [Novosphingobium sp.]HZV08419.1 SURF1 family protein [Novosphingobium sp.]
MSRRVPVIPTLVVLLAVALMLRLGVWQLDRLREKEAMIARYQAALALPALDWAEGVPLGAAPAYRRVRLACQHFGQPRMVGGRNGRGVAGWALWADCTAPSGSITVVAGWSARPETAALPGAAGVSGIVLVGKGGEMRLVADPPLAGLAANARPDPHDLPNNHFSYAMQWFAFAATALVIYGLALRARWRRGASDFGGASGSA